jgi:type II secretory pathway component PulC
VKTYAQLFWNLLMLLFVLALGYFGYEGWTLSQTVNELANRPQITVGSDKDLEETVDRMENTLASIQSQTFNVSKDPLEITRVVIARSLLLDDKSFLASLESRPRLSCTIKGENPRAIVRLRSKNHVVGVGDSFEGYRVMAIGDNSISLNRNGQLETLRVQAAAKDLAKRLASGQLDW